MSSFLVGRTVKMAAEYRNDEGGLADVVITGFTVRKPGATDPVTVDPGDVVHPSVGRYHVLVTPAVDEAGDWSWRMDAHSIDGTAELPVEDTFRVEASAVLATTP